MVRSLGQEDPLEKEHVTHSSIIAWKIPWTEDPTGGYSPWSHKRVGYDLATKQLTAKQLANISKLRIITSRPS